MASVIPLDEIASVTTLDLILNEEKFKTFKWYCGHSVLQILGVVENQRSKAKVSQNKDVKKFMRDREIWITLQRSKFSPEYASKAGLPAELTLKSFKICEHIQKVRPHFFLYPNMGTGEFLALNDISFNDVLNNSIDWDKNKPLIEECELSKQHDLTDNDIIIRQINCSLILAQLLDKRVKGAIGKKEFSHCHEKFDFEDDFYGNSGYWTSKNGFVLRFMALLFYIIYHPYRLMVEFFLLLQRFNMLNCVVMIKRKKHQLTTCSNYLQILTRERPQRNLNMFDFHFYKLALYTKFAAILTQMVLDIIFGILFMKYLHTQTTSVLIVFHWIGQDLQLEVLKKQTEWLRDKPGGFTPNPNLAEFIGDAILDLILIWNHGTSAFIRAQTYILTNLAYLGILGSTI